MRCECLPASLPSAHTAITLSFLQSPQPTNDLDVDTLRCLEEAIEHFAGSVLIVSHDRWFLDRVATHILAYEGDSKVTSGPLVLRACLNTTHTCSTASHMQTWLRPCLPSLHQYAYLHHPTLHDASCCRQLGLRVGTVTTRRTASGVDSMQSHPRASSSASWPTFSGQAGIEARVHYMLQS